jgi:hypothetical protein
MAPNYRAAVYRMLECCNSHTVPFSYITNAILIPEMQKFNQDQSSLLWPVFRSCVKLIENYSFNCDSVESFDMSVNFLSFVLFQPKMNIICKFLAAIAFRSLLSWSRIPQNHMHSVMAKISAQLCAAVSQIFAAMYSSHEPLDDDLTETTLLQLLPLQGDLIEHVSQQDAGPVSVAIVRGFVTLWKEDVPNIVQIEIVRALKGVVKSAHKLVPDLDASLAFIPLLKNLMYEAVKRNITDCYSLMATIVKRSKPAEELRAFVLELVNVVPTTVLLDDVNLTYCLSCILSLEEKLSASQASFMFCKKVVSIVTVVASPPDVALLVFLVQMHALFKTRMNVMIIENQQQKSYFANYLSRCETSSLHQYVNMI